MFSFFELSKDARVSGSLRFFKQPAQEDMHLKIVFHLEEIANIQTNGHENL